MHIGNRVQLWATMFLGFEFVTFYESVQYGPVGIIFRLMSNHGSYHSDLDCMIVAITDEPEAQFISRHLTRIRPSHLHTSARDIKKRLSVVII